ncbi:SGNH/GDSL hydrolase family protein [Vicingaceae bacterium]|nr:SGNH/GDSL hydrolase family protein [Vicingaceae bacterium]
MISLRITVIVLLFLIVSACNTTSSTSKESANPTTAVKNQFTYLALGDSYTIGEMVEQHQSFPFRLASALAAKTDLNIATPRVIAKTGWRTDQLLDSITAVKEQYDLVSLLIGVNNQYQGKDIEVFTKEFKLLIEKAIGFSKTGKKGVFVYSIPDYSVMPFMRGKKVKKVSAEIKNYNAISSTVAQKMGVSFYNITPISQKAQYDSGLIAVDKLHPGGNMYALWVSEFVEQIISNQIR